MSDVTIATSSNGLATNASSDFEYETPAVTFERITFSDGTTVELSPNDVVVLVGPNNAGKSLALRELEGHLQDSVGPIAVKEVKRRIVGTQEDFRKFVDEHMDVRPNGTSRRYSAYGLSISTRNDVIAGWPQNFSRFVGMFCMRLSTETRIGSSNPAGAINFLEEPAAHPIHMLHLDDELESRMSRYFKRAFGQELIVFRTGGSIIPLVVGMRPTPQEGEDRISKTYLERVRDATVQLQHQGDGMRSFASAILYLLAPITPSVLLLDEPEAFLHPPQARLLGELIATEKRNRSQLFVATHSPDVIQGLINVAPENLRVIRMQRDEDVNRVKELNKELVKEISIDPLMKYSSVSSGVFHERVIICESDADCMFYSTVLDLPCVRGERQPDVLFVHGNGKDRMAKLAATLKALDVPVDVIADIDVLNDSTKLGAIVEALGGDPTQIKQLAESIKAGIEGEKPPLDSQQVKDAINGILDEIPTTGNVPNGLRSKIDAVFRDVSPWAAVKRAGAAAIPKGQSTQQFLELQSLCAGIGLRVVPVGELEGFCKSIGGHGPAWVQQVIQKDLAGDAELEDAREFVREIWTSR